MMDGGRKRKARVSPWQPTCLLAFTKPSRVEKREGLTVTDRPLCETRGRPTCCPPTPTAPPCAASGPSQHAGSIRGHDTDTLPPPPHSSNALHIPRWTSRLVGPQVAMPTDNTQHPIPPHRTHPPVVTQTQRTCSITRQTGPDAERLNPSGVKQSTSGV